MFPILIRKKRIDGEDIKEKLQIKSFIKSIGTPIDKSYTEENLQLLEKGVANLQHHIRNAVSFSFIVRAVHG